MKGIKVVTRFYREEYLVPLFLKHYAFADSIIVLGGKSPDRTQELFEADPRVVWVPLEMPEGVDDILMMNATNQVINHPDPFHDWSIAVDSDEFVWPHDGKAPHELTRDSVLAYLSQVPQTDSVLKSNMWQVFRHETDADLDPSVAPALQRRHGEHNRDTGGREGYRKPNVIRTNREVRLGVGNHHVDTMGVRISDQFSFDGAHWAMADPSFVIRRIRDRRDRMSPRNRAGRLGGHLYDVTEEGLLADINSHRNEPLLF